MKHSWHHLHYLDPIETYHQPRHWTLHTLRNIYVCVVIIMTSPCGVHNMKYANVYIHLKMFKSTTWIFLCSIYILVKLKFVKSTMDLNMHEIRYLAGKLSRHECKRLAEALHQNTYALQGTVDGSSEPNVRCLYLLLRWDLTEGKGKTFHDLALRLRQLGHADLANKLSRTVYHDKAAAINKYFLDNPFKKMIPTESFLLDEEDMVTPKSDLTVISGNQNDWTAQETVALVMGCISLFLLALTCLVYCCSSNMFNPKQLAPDFIVNYCESLMSSGKIFCIRFRKHFYKHLIGVKDIST